MELKMYVSSMTPEQERARRAVRELNKMNTSLRALVRAMTGKPTMQVIPTAGTPRTDGKNIYVRPPIELGDEKPHQSTLCDKRDIAGQQRCPACRAREDVIITLFHEIGHNLYDSFEKVRDDRRASIVSKAVRRAATEHGEYRAEQARKRLEKADDLSFQAVAAIVSPYMPLLFNALEDGRINRRTMAASPGTRAMFHAQLARIFENGIDGLDGEVTHWRDQPRSAQIIIGLLGMVMEYDVSPFIQPEVAADLTNPRLAEIAEAVAVAPDAATIYEVLFDTLDVLQSMNYCLTEKDVPPPPEPEPDHEDTGGDDDDEGEPDEGHDPRDEPPAATEGSVDDEEEDGSSADGMGNAESDDDDSSGSADDGDDDASAGDSGGDDEEDESDGGPSDDGDSGDDSEGDAGTDAASDGEPGEVGDADPGSEEDDGDDGGEGESSGVGADDGLDGGTTSTPADGTPDDATSDPTGADEATPDPSAYVEDADDVEAAQRALDEVRGHGEEVREEDSMTKEEQQELERELDRAINQVEHFEGPSTGVYKVEVHTTDFPRYWRPWEGARDHLEPCPESAMAPALAHMRRVFSENRKGKVERNLKRGKVDPGMLGKRAPVDDPRMMRRRVLPGKKSYHVILGLDMSGSTAGGTAALIKSAAAAQADLLARMGIDFSIYAHSGHTSGGGWSPDEYGYTLDIMEVKRPGAPWDNTHKDRLGALNAVFANLDGHTMQYYRKRLDECRGVTNRILMYYTDGGLPAENYHEELSVLTDELAIIKRKGYTLACVGVHNSEPQNYGLDTVRIDSMADVPAVVKHLEKVLVR